MRVRRPACPFALFVVAWLLGGSLAEAAILLTIENSSIPAGGSGTLDVWIVSDSPLGESLSQFGFEFRISTTGVTRLEFIDPQSDLQLSSPQYVFSGNSLSEAFPPVGLNATTIVPNDTYLGGDATLDALNVTVGAAPLLLARLELTTQTALPPVAGDTFLVELIAGPNTYFQDSDFQSLAFRSTAGTAAIEVPEPGSLVLIATACLCATFASVRRRTFAA